jgi:hypothetical protein
VNLPQLAYLKRCQNESDPVGSYELGTAQLLPTGQSVSLTRGYARILRLLPQNADVFVDAVDFRECGPPVGTPGRVPRPQLTTALMMLSTGPCCVQFGFLRLGELLLIVRIAAGMADASLRG